MHSTRVPTVCIPQRTSTQAATAQHTSSPAHPAAAPAPKLTQQRRPAAAPCSSTLRASSQAHTAAALQRHQHPSSSTHARSSSYIRTTVAPCSCTSTQSRKRTHTQLFPYLKQKPTSSHYLGENRTQYKKLLISAYKKLRPMATPQAGSTPLWHVSPHVRRVDKAAASKLGNLLQNVSMSG